MRGPFEPDRVRVEEMADWRRGNPSDICDICGCRTIEHQPVPGYPWLRKLCDGELIKMQK
ncbi:hypothetical protein RPALISO_131 [Ruegeria phage RpAliso]|nr:hypothetical protein RPALISO_131 [Ruegeria phage RpAliso]